MLIKLTHSHKKKKKKNSDFSANFTPCLPQTVQIECWMTSGVARAFPGAYPEDQNEEEHEKNLRKIIEKLRKE